MKLLDGIASVQVIRASRSIAHMIQASWVMIVLIEHKLTNY